MVNKHNPEIIDGANTLTQQGVNLTTIKSGKEAAAATVQLMKKTFNTIQPETIVDAYIADKANFVTSFYNSTGKTALPKLFKSGAETLASLWNSAWELGNGSANIKNLSGITSDEIKALYQSKDFLPSTNIRGIKTYLD